MSPTGQPSPGTERYWEELGSDWTPQQGDLARLRDHSAAAAVYVLDTHHCDGEITAVLLDALVEDHVRMLVDGDVNQREALVAPIRNTHDEGLLRIPTDDLAPLLGGVTDV